MAEQKKTNIIFILTDDQGYWSLGSYGNKDALSPTLDGLAAQGMLFENFFCVSPVCSPARASILTGRIPSQHGVLDWLDDTENEYLYSQSNFVERLAVGGYTCCLSGKWHLGAPGKMQMGFSHWYALKYGGGSYYGASVCRDGHWEKEPAYISDAITDYALDFLKSPRGDAPFFLALHYTAPHAPWGPKEHPAELRALFENCPFDSCPIDPPHPWKIDVMFDGQDQKERHSILSSYFASLVSVDNNIKRIVDLLKEQGEYEDTLIIFTSDNGMNMGHHGFYGKGNGTSPVNMYDTSVKVPFFATHPKGIKPGKAQSLYSHYDLRATILEYVGVADIPHEVPLPGKSFAGLLKGSQSETLDSSIVVYDEYGPCRMIRTGQWKYIHRYPSGPHELYDIFQDPNEKNNLIVSSQHQSTISILRKHLRTWFKQYVNPEIDGAQLPVYGGGQRNWAGLWGPDDDLVFDRYESPFIFTEDSRLTNERKGSGKQL